MDRGRNRIAVKTIVTGGAGYMGSHLVDALLAEGHEVSVIDNLSAGTLDNLIQHNANHRFRFVRGDVRDYDLLRTAFEGIDLVFHLAAQCVPLSIYDPTIVHEVNATGALMVCRACLDAKVPRLLHVASSEVYGSAHYTPMDEDHPLDPTTPYGAAKVAGELYVRTFARTYGLSAVVVRPFNSYGPRLPYEGPYGNVIPKFVVRVLAGQPPLIYGDGEQTRDFTFASDTVRGVMGAAFADDMVGDVVNIARGREVSVNEIAAIVLKQLGRPDLEPVYLKPRPGDVRRHFADVSRARDRIGFVAEVNIEEGIRQYIDWFRSLPVDAVADALPRDWDRTWVPERS
jgi:UDP-glucose 4-epimerase